MTQENPSYQQLLNEVRQQKFYIQDLESKVGIEQSDPQQHRKAQLIDFVLDAVVSSDDNFNLITWNQAAEDMYGWKAEEVIGHNALELFRTRYFDNADPKEVQEEYKKVGVWRGNMIHHRKDGTPISVRGTSSFIRNSDGDVVGSVAILRDISQELEAEKAIQENKRLYQIISELMSDYAFLYHVNEDKSWYRVWITSDNFYQITGYKDDEILEGYKLYHPNDVAKVAADVERTLNGEDTEGEYRIITKDGIVKWIYISRHALWDEDQQRVIGFYGAGRDITSQRVISEELQYHHLEQERVAILRNFIQGASHDLKTPLSTINTSIYILRKLATSDRQLVQLDKLEFHINRLTAIIEDMFEMARLDLITSLSLEDTNINSPLLDMITIYQELADQQHIELINQLETQPIYARVEIQSLIQAVSNIIDNAIQYTPENGSVTVQTYLEDNWVVIVVKDTGIGIPLDEISDVFTRFYRGDKARNANSMASTGLGLSIVKKIVSLHHGQLEVKSKVGEGSCFYIRLPHAH